MELRGRTLLMTGGVLTTLYSVLVLGFVVTGPDLRLRCLLVDDGGSLGLQIRGTPGIAVSGQLPTSGDHLLELGDRSTANFFDFSQVIQSLHHVATPPGGLLDAGTNPIDIDDAELPWLVEENQTGRKWVRIKVQPPEGSSFHSWVEIQSAPLSEIVLTFVWLVFQLAICAVAALAWWHRPFDRAARLFFGMCTVTLGAFVGGYHWHQIAGNLWLSLPLIAFIVLLPPVTLHFFLVYPRPKSPLNRSPRGMLCAIYLPALLALAGVGFLLLRARFLSLGVSGEVRSELIEHALGALRSGIYHYLIVGVSYFGLTIGALVDSLVTTRNAYEQNQVKWILWAGIVAAVLVCGTLVLAWLDRAEFAFGRARILFFLASVALMLAYAVAIIRHKLMLIDQILDKGVWYWVASSGLTLAVSVAITAGSRLDQWLHLSMTMQQSVAAIVLLGLTVILLLWLRDFGQQTIDQRFFREKYQLDRTLQRMNQAVDYLGDQPSLAKMLLGSCADVLRIEHSALYLRNSESEAFRIVARLGEGGHPEECLPTHEQVQALSAEGSIQRVDVSTRSELTSTQNLLRELHADLVHAIQSGTEVVGLVVLGEKSAGGAFTAEDLTYLHTISQITHVALQTARVREDLARMTEELNRRSDRLDDQGRQITLLQSELNAVQQDVPVERVEPRVESLLDASFRRDAVRGSSPPILRVLDTARKVAASDSTVLIHGESGTGKELLAQVLHDNSPRRDGPMVRVHCAALSSGLLESELFGHVKGAFTGAHKDRIGRFEAAHKGTLFLDEIGDISLETQVKLLRVLQERCFEPVGGSRTVQVDVRLVTATHQDLPKLIALGRFREDLYYRLNVISLTLPPLRERPKDVHELAIYFLERSAARLGKPARQIDDDALSLLERHSWPGNIRELENVIERAVVLCDGELITRWELPVEFRSPPRDLPRHVVESKPLAGTPLEMPSTVRGTPMPPVKLPPFASRPEENAERAALVDALEKCQGNKAHAARLLGIPRSTLFSRLKKHGIE